MLARRSSTVITCAGPATAVPAAPLTAEAGGENFLLLPPRALEIGCADHVITGMALSPRRIPRIRAIRARRPIARIMGPMGETVGTVVVATRQIIRFQV